MSITQRGVQFKRTRKNRRLFTAFLVLAEFVLSFFVYLSFAAHIIWPENSSATQGVAQYLSYEGRLTDTSGNPLGGAGSDYCFKFSIYDGATSGSKLWPTAAATGQSITVTDGVFDALIGTADTLDFNFYSNDTVYLDVAVANKLTNCSGAETYESLTPRQRIAATGYAITSAYVYGSLLKTDVASGTVQIGPTGGTATGTMLTLGVKNNADSIGSTCTVPGMLWYNSSNNRALVCEGGYMVAIGNSPTSTLAGIKEASAGAAISSATVVFSGVNGVSILQNGQTLSVSGQNAFGLSNLGNVQGNTGVVTGSVVLAGGNNVTLSQNGSTITVNAGGGGGGGATLSNFQWPPGQASTYGAYSNATLSFTPFPLQQNLTASEANVMFSANVQTSTNNTMQGTISISIGIYSRNASTLNLASSGSQSFSWSQTSTSSSRSYNSVKRFTIPISINATPGEYWYALWVRTSNAAASQGTIGLSLIGGASTSAFMGNWGLNSSNTSYQVLAGQGIYSVSTSNALPAGVVLSQIQGGGATPHALRQPWVLFTNFDGS